MRPSWLHRRFGRDSKIWLSLKYIVVGVGAPRLGYPKEACVAWVAERDEQFEGMDIPAIIVREIREKLLPAAEGDTSALPAQ